MLSSNLKRKKAQNFTKNIIAKEEAKITFFSSLIQGYFLWYQTFLVELFVIFYKDVQSV